MSSSPPGAESSSGREYATIWHPVREWFEANEDDDDHQIPELESPERQAYSDEENGAENEDEEEYEDGLRLFAERAGPSYGNIHVEFTMDDSDHDGGGLSPTTRVSAARLLQLLASNPLRDILHFDGWHGDTLFDDDDNDLGELLRHRMRTRRRTTDNKYPKPPSEQGTELMGSGLFGSNPCYVNTLRKRKRTIATKLMWRELRIYPDGAWKRERCSMAQDLIPGSVADKIIHFDSRCYSGQFSDDGNFFFCCSQDFKVRMYDTSNPYEWRYYKAVDYPFGRWTITDATLSPDNRFLAYSSIRNLVCLASTDPADQSDPTILDFSSSNGRGSHVDYFGIYSVRFSGDGREIVAGTGEDDPSVVVYDLETQQAVLRLQNHQADVNAVCFGDVSSPHILYSGSDDTTLRVWDRRSMGDGREAGVFIGHTEGLTYIDSKGDGRYVLSNGKDQTMKLWDLRKMMTTEKFDTIDIRNYTTGFEYRWDSYPEEYYEPHPHDCSVVTFVGHRVLKTLIRCHFSPPGSTNSRYVYTGSQDGKVYVYNLDATLAGTIDVGGATHNPQSHGRYGWRGSWKTCVRDASWHPNAPVLAATSWNGSSDGNQGPSAGTCTLHSWNDGASEDEGDPPVGANYDCKLVPLHQPSHGNSHLRR
ncbi:hypothetical protein MAP00_008288 [Monascus purpureus]|nr:hypothetical protein MAP00_008288 [Monascus purpureus]